MTGRKLLEKLNSLTPEQLDDFDLSVKVDDEFFTLTDLIVNDPDAEGILDEGSPVLISLASA